MDGPDNSFPELFVQLAPRIGNPGAARSLTIPNIASACGQGAPASNLSRIGPVGQSLRCSIPQ